MASLWQTGSGVWCIILRENGEQRVRSLRTKSKREALKPQHGIECLLQEGKDFEVSVKEESPEPEHSPPFQELGEEFLSWTNGRRSPCTIEEYKNWYTKLRDSSAIARLGDAKPQSAENFKKSLGQQGKRKLIGVGLDKAGIDNALKTLRF